MYQLEDDSWWLYDAGDYQTWVYEIWHCGNHVTIFKSDVAGVSQSSGSFEVGLKHYSNILANILQESLFSWLKTRLFQKLLAGLSHPSDQLKLSWACSSDQELSPQLHCVESDEFGGPDRSFWNVVKIHSRIMRCRLQIDLTSHETDRNLFWNRHWIKNLMRIMGIHLVSELEQMIMVIIFYCDLGSESENSWIQD